MGEFGQGMETEFVYRHRMEEEFDYRLGTQGEFE